MEHTQWRECSVCKKDRKVEPERFGRPALVVHNRFESDGRSVMCDGSGAGIDGKRSGLDIFLEKNPGLTRRWVFTGHMSDEAESAYHEWARTLEAFNEAEANLREAELRWDLLSGLVEKLPDGTYRRWQRPPGKKRAPRKKPLTASDRQPSAA